MIKIPSITINSYLTPKTTREIYNHFVEIPKMFFGTRFDDILKFSIEHALSSCIYQLRSDQMIFMEFPPKVEVILTKPGTVTAYIDGELYDRWMAKALDYDARGGIVGRRILPPLINIETGESFSDQLINMNGCLYQIKTKTNLIYQEMEKDIMTGIVAPW